MQYSELKHDIEMLELSQKHEIEIIKMRHKEMMDKKISQCTHEFDDGSNAKISRSTQWEQYCKCDICGKQTN